MLMLTDPPKRVNLVCLLSSHISVSMSHCFTDPTCFLNDSGKIFTYITNINICISLGLCNSFTLFAQSVSILRTNVYYHRSMCRSKSCISRKHGSEDMPPNKHMIFFFEEYWKICWFWDFRRVQNVVCILLGISPASRFKSRRFGTQCRSHRPGRSGRWDRHWVPKRRLLNFRRQRNSQKNINYWKIWLLDFRSVLTVAYISGSQNCSVTNQISNLFVPLSTCSTLQKIRAYF